MTAIFLALAPVTGLALVPMASAQAQAAEVNISLFYEQLGTEGRWAQHPRWGWVWYPTQVDADWRPYTRGRWVWTQEYGWYWVSDESFGWATYHYGRWSYDDQYGWVWVPGERWGGAWVAFRYSDQHIGWAPLPPDMLEVNSEVQIDDAVFTADYYQPRWVFVESRYFVAPDIRAHVAPRESNVGFIRDTRNVTNIRIQGDVFVNRSFEPARIRQFVGRDIPTVRVQLVDDVSTFRQRRTETNVTVINVFNPRIRIDRDRTPPERARARDTDRPRAAVRPEWVRPEERRGADRDRTQPGQPRTTEPAKPGQPGEPRTTEPTKPGQPAQPRTGEPERGTTPGTPRTGQDRDRTKPAEPPKAAPGAPPTTPRATPPDSPKAPAKPEAPGTQPNQRQQTPGQRPGQEGRGDERRGAAPTQPAQPPSRTEPAQPPRGATPAQPPSRATPAQPPSTAPGAPPSRAQPPAQATPPSKPPQRTAPPAQTPSEPGKKEEEKTPSR